MNPRDVPEVVAELIMEMHEVRSELQALNGRLDRMDGRLESMDGRLESMDGQLAGANNRLDRMDGRLEGANNRLDRVESEIRQMREENRQNTDRLIDAFGRSMEPLINRILAHEQRLTSLENPAAE